MLTVAIANVTCAPSKRSEAAGLGEGHAWAMHHERSWQSVVTQKVFEEAACPGVIDHPETAAPGPRL